MIKPEAELTTSDWQLIHKYRNNRALLRRKGLSVKLREQLERQLPELEAEAKERGIATYLPGWRKYVDPDAPLTFGAHMTGDRIDHRGPVEQPRKPRPSPASKPPVEQLDDLEALLARSLELVKR